MTEVLTHFLNETFYVHEREMMDDCSFKSFM
jgi:hypothetical protein